MKRAFVVCICIMFFGLLRVSAGDVLPQDLYFTPQGEGKYIYCNNNEAITREDLSDISNPNPVYIMNNENMGADRYSLFISLFNYTGISGRNRSLIELGFDVEVDVQFKAKEDTTLIINSTGFEAMQTKNYYYNGTLMRYEESWACLNAWAQYKQMTVRQINSQRIYPAGKQELVQVTLKKGEEVWLSKFIENYNTVTYLKVVHLLSDFEIVSGLADINIAALKSNGKLRDRSHHDNKAARGIYHRDRQYKGIADTLPQVNANVAYTVDDNVEPGSKLPVTVYNQYNPEGNTVFQWMTHINPQEDVWSRSVCAESDMIAMYYFDGEKLQYYGKNVAEEEKDPVWYFDVFHSDTKEYDGEVTGYSVNNYMPNYRLSTERNNIGYGCNLGNYGVSTNYNVTINNTGTKDRYFYYKLKTISNNIVILKDDQGEIGFPYPVCKGGQDKKTEDIMACVKLPANEETTFSIEVILPPNYPGGMENSFEIADVPYEVTAYEPVSQVSIKNPRYTGREYYKWYGGRLYFSDDQENWQEKPINDAVSKIFEGNWNNYEIKDAGNGYMAKWKAYDAAPAAFRAGSDFRKEVYFFDLDFNLTGKHRFDEYPTEMSYAKGYYFVRAGKTYYSKDAARWTEFENAFNLPEDNGLGFSAAMKNGETHTSLDGLHYFKINYVGERPDYIETFGDVYYYADRNKLYLSRDAVYWTMVEADSDIKSFHMTDEKIIINDTQTVDMPPLERNIMVKLNDTFLSFDKTPVIEDGRTLVPVRFIAEKLGASVSWNEEEKKATINKGQQTIIFTIDKNIVTVNGEEIEMDVPARQLNWRTLIPVRFLSETLGLAVGWDADARMVTIDGNF